MIRLVRMSQIMPRVEGLSHKFRHHPVKCHEFAVALSNCCFFMKMQKKLALFVFVQNQNLLIMRGHYTFEKIQVLALVHPCEGPV